MKTKLVDVTELELYGNRLWHNGQEYTASCRKVDEQMLDLDAELRVKLAGQKLYRISGVPLDCSDYWSCIAQPGDKFEVIEND